MLPGLIETNSRRFRAVWPKSVPAGLFAVGLGVPAAFGDAPWAPLLAPAGSLGPLAL